jgi:hypothetical protein
MSEVFMVAIQQGRAHTHYTEPITQAQTVETDGDVCEVVKRLHIHILVTNKLQSESKTSCTNMQSDKGQ